MADHAQPQLSHGDDQKSPHIPAELVSKILDHLNIHDSPILLRPTRSIDTAYLTGKALDSTPRSRKKYSRRTPVPIHAAPLRNILLASKSFHDEYIKHFYSKNPLQILGDSHLNDILTLLGTNERASVQHIVLDSRCKINEINVPALPVFPKPAPVFDARLMWGEWSLGNLRLDSQDEAAFPNLQSMTLRVRCKKRHTFAELLRGYKDKTPETRAIMEEQAAYDIAAEWYHRLGDDCIPMIKVAFLWSKSKPWDDDTPVRPLSSFERVRDGSYKRDTDIEAAALGT